MTSTFIFDGRLGMVYNPDRGCWCKVENKVWFKTKYVFNDTKKWQGFYNADILPSSSGHLHFIQHTLASKISSIMNIPNAMLHVYIVPIVFEFQVLGTCLYMFVLKWMLPRNDFLAAWDFYLFNGI